MGQTKLLAGAIDFDKLRDTVGLKTGLATVGEIVSTSLRFLFAIAGFLLLLYLLYGGFKFLTSRGDPGAVKEGQGIITTAIVGFVIIFTAYWIIQIVGIIFNIQAIKETFG